MLRAKRLQTLGDLGPQTVGLPVMDEQRCSIGVKGAGHVAHDGPHQLVLVDNGPDRPADIDERL